MKLSEGSADIDLVCKDHKMIEQILKSLEVSNRIFVPKKNQRFVLMEEVRVICPAVRLFSHIDMERSAKRFEDWYAKFNPERAKKELIFTSTDILLMKQGQYHHRSFYTSWKEARKACAQFFVPAGTIIRFQNISLARKNVKIQIPLTKDESEILETGTKITVPIPISTWNVLAMKAL